MTRIITTKWNKKYNVVFTDHTNGMVFDMEFRNIFGGEYYDNKTFELQDNEKISHIFDKMKHTSQNLVAGVTFEVPATTSLLEAIDNFTPKGLEYVKIQRRDAKSRNDDIYEFLYNGDTKYMEIKKNGEVLTQNSRLPERTDEMKLLVREFSEALSPAAQDHIILTDRWRIYNAKHCYTEELSEMYNPVISDSVGCITGSLVRDEETGLIKAEFREIIRNETNSNINYNKGDSVTVYINGNIDENRLAMIESVHNHNLRGLLSAMELTLTKPNAVDTDSEFPIQKMLIESKNMDRAIAYMESVNAFRPTGKQVPARVILGGVEVEYKNDITNNEPPIYQASTPFDVVTYSTKGGLESDITRKESKTVYDVMERFAKLCDNTTMERSDKDKKRLRNEIELDKKGELVKEPPRKIEDYFHSDLGEFPTN